MPQIELKPSRAGHIPQALRGLLSAGWAVRQVPRGGKLPRNGLRLVLRAAHGEVRLRLFAYKVTGSSRGRPDERRIEITSTYQKGLKRLKAYRDVVLGYDEDHNVFVGVDPERIVHGGPTGNASSFFDQAGLSHGLADRIHIRQREARLFPKGVEYHAFVKPRRLAEYFFNSAEIHSGIYAHGGPFSGRLPKTLAHYPIAVPAGRSGGDELVLEGPQPTRRRLRIRAGLAKAYEDGNISALRGRRITPEEFEELRRRFEENGRLGEDFVLKHEKEMLRRAGRDDLAKKVRLVSLESVADGYDVLSFTPSGKRKLIEVKSTSGDSPNFEISEHEWHTARVNSNCYYVYRITRVRTTPALTILRNLVLLESQGRLTKTATGWMVRPTLS